MLEKAPPSADMIPPTAVPAADSTWELDVAPLPASMPWLASQVLSVSRPAVSSVRICGAWPTTPATTSQVEPTTTAVSARSTSRAPPERGTPRASSRSTTGAKSAPSTRAMMKGTTNPETWAISQSTAAANASRPRSSHERSPPPHQSR